MPTELSNLELGLELELNSDDVAAAEAAVAAHGELLTCSCCNQELNDKESLHLHQISQHSISQLSIALLSLRGFDVSSGIETEATQDICLPDSDSESTESAHSSLMCRFVDDFNTAVAENGPCSANNLNISGVGLSENTQYSPPGVKNSDLDSGLSRNRQISDPSQTTEADDETNFGQCVNISPFPNSDVPVAQRMDENQRQTSPLHDFRESTRRSSEIRRAQLKSQKNRKKRVKSTTGTTSPKENKKVTLGESNNCVMDLTASKTRNLTCTKPASRGTEEQTNDAKDHREFSCEICGRRYKRKSHLGRHIRMHSGVRPFPCTLCDKRFAVRSILKQHMRVHTGERPFKCLFCFQRFPQKSGLVTHMMLHTGKPYKCDLCSKSFVSNHKLSVHKRSHEEQSGRWPSLGPHSCTTCGTRFFTTSALMEHGKVHCSADATQSEVRVRANSGDYLREDPNLNKHNSQEVTAGQALLTLMDSNAITQELTNESISEEEHTDSLRHTNCFSGMNENGNGEVSLDFEFCDVPIELKEECFEFEDNLAKMCQRRDSQSD